MRLVLQRVHRATVVVEGSVKAVIGRGLLVFLGVGDSDDQTDVDWLVSRVAKVRVFEDDAGKMSHAVSDIDGEAMVISQFTLFGNLRKGNRPSFNRAADPEHATALYGAFVNQLSARIGRPVATGEFGAHMDIEAANDGPVTLVLDSRERGF